MRKPASASQLGTRYAEIRAWRPGCGLNPKGGYALEPAADVLPIHTAVPETFYLKPLPDVPNSDWALLKFNDSVKSGDMGLPCVEAWFDEYPERA